MAERASQRTGARLRRIARSHARTVLGIADGIERLRSPGGVVSEMLSRAGGALRIEAQTVVETMEIEMLRSSADQMLKGAERAHREIGRASIAATIALASA